MEYLITESQYKLLVEVVRIPSTDEENIIVYEYTSLYVPANKYNSEKIGLVFFNGIKDKKSDYTKPNVPNPNTTIIRFTGPNGDFDFPMWVVNKSKSGSYNPYVKERDLTSKQYKELLPFLVVKVKDSFTSEEITKALEMTFSGNTTGKGGIWVPETKDFSAGVRGIYPVGDQLNSDESWSIMNWFNTKDTIKELINNKWLKEGSGDRVEWLSSVFQNDKKFLDELVIKQWSSIKDGLKREDAALNNLIKMLEGKKFTYELYPPGHKTDRYDSIDISITIENGKPITFQVKPLNSDPTLKDGETKITTYGMSNFYKNKNKLNYIMYNNGNDYILFKNKDYRVFNDGREVIHSGEPLTTIF